MSDRMIDLATDLITIPKSPSNLKFKMEEQKLNYEFVNQQYYLGPFNSKKTLVTQDYDPNIQRKTSSETSNLGRFSSMEEQYAINIIPDTHDPHSLEIESTPKHKLLEPFLKLDKFDFFSKDPDNSFDENSFEHHQMEEEYIHAHHFTHRNDSPDKEFIKETTKKELEDQLSQEIESQKALGQLERENSSKMEIESNHNTNENPKSSKSKVCCTCKKSKCLQRYCECFRTSGYCTSLCSCQECYNKEEFNYVRKEFYNEQLQRNPSSFSSKIVNLSTVMIYAKGCNCKKTECMKNYCECYAAKVKCTNLCKCCGCQNFDDTLINEDLHLLQERTTKKRKKSEKNFQEALMERLATRKGTLDNLETTSEHICLKE